MDQWQLEELAKVRRQANDQAGQRRAAAGGVAAAVRRAGRQRRGRRGRRPGANMVPQATIAVIPKGPYVLAELA